MTMTFEKMRDALRGVSDAHGVLFSIYQEIIAAEAAYLRRMDTQPKVGRFENSERFIIAATEHLTADSEHRKWGDSPFAGTQDISRISRTGDDIELRLRRAVWRDTDTATETILIPSYLINAHGTDDFAAALDRFIETQAAPILAEYEETIRLNQERAAKDALAAEERDRAEFARLSEKFGGAS